MRSRGYGLATLDITMPAVAGIVAPNSVSQALG